MSLDEIDDLRLVSQFRHGAGEYHPVKQFVLPGIFQLLAREGAPTGEAVFS